MDGRGWTRRLAAGGAALVLLASGPAAPGQAVSSRVSQVAVPGATCAVVHDGSALLAVGRAGTGDFSLVLFGLDGRTGAVTGEVARFALPAADSLKAYANYALGLAVHPQLPLLYVWQDIAGPASGPGQAAVYADFEHLLIYSLTSLPLSLLQSCVRGTNCAYGQQFGAVALDPAGKRIFLPNLQDPVSSRAAIGYLVLQGNGLPVLVDGVAPVVAGDVADVRGNPTGWGFVPGSDKVAIFSGVSGPVTWDTENRRAALGYVLVRGTGQNSYVGGHPTKPVMYSASYGSGFACSLLHADGFLTLLPQTTNVAASFTSPPVVLPGTPDRLAVGGANRIHFIPLDTQGHLAGPAEEMTVTCAGVRAMAWSRRFGRLYAAVDQVP